MTPNMPLVDTPEALNAVLNEDQLRSWVLRGRVADLSPRDLMEKEANIEGGFFA